MYEFLSNNSLFVVLVIVLLIWLGIVFYLFYIDKKMKKLEDTFSERTYVRNQNE